MSMLEKVAEAAFNDELEKLALSPAAVMRIGGMAVPGIAGGAAGAAGGAIGAEKGKRLKGALKGGALGAALGAGTGAGVGMLGLSRLKKITGLPKKTTLNELIQMYKP